MSEEQKIVFEYLTQNSAKAPNLSLPNLLSALLASQKLSEIWYSLDELKKADVLFHTSDFMIVSRDSVSLGHKPPVPYKRS